MIKRMKKIDMLASVLLVGVISATALSQVGPPVPKKKYCPGGTATINGIAYQYGGIWCWENQSCGATINYNTETGEIESVTPVCLETA